MARDLEHIRNRLSVGHRYHTLVTGYDHRKFDEWLVYHWTTAGMTVLGRFPREDDAWGVASLILEYVGVRGLSEQTAIDATLTTYRNLAPPTVDLDDDSRRAQDHAHEMGVRP